MRGGSVNLTNLLIFFVVAIVVLLILRDVFAWWNKISVMIHELRDANHRLQNIVDNQVAMSKQLERICENTAAKPAPVVPYQYPSAPQYSYPPPYQGAPDA